PVGLLIGPNSAEQVDGILERPSGLRRGQIRLMSPFRTHFLQQTRPTASLMSDLPEAPEVPLIYEHQQIARIPTLRRLVVEDAAGFGHPIWAVGLAHLPLDERPPHVLQ